MGQSINHIRNLLVNNINHTNLNTELTVYDLWDGYIKFGFTKFNLFGEPFEPRIGDTVRDVTTGATAKITFYQRDALNATIFVKNVVGIFSNGSVFGNNAEIKFLGTPPPIINKPEPLDLIFISVNSLNSLIESIVI